MLSLLFCERKLEEKIHKIKIEKEKSVKDNIKRYRTLHIMCVFKKKKKYLSCIFSKYLVKFYFCWK